jgi:cation transport regulator ChaC
VNTEPEFQQPAWNAQNNPDTQSSERVVAPEVQIVRGNTPRPHSFSQSASFPVAAPAAPPLPEESNERDNCLDDQLKQTPLPLAEAAQPAEPEFAWLFEYGPEMDMAYLNSAERLAGAALLYGPGVLQGYAIAFDALNARDGHVVATIAPSKNRGDEVWGILYRVPSRMLRAQENVLPLLDGVHSAAPPDGFFERIEVTVHETYRERDIACITYIASTVARNEYHLLPPARQAVDGLYVQRLLETAQKQKLPASYVAELSRGGGSAPPASIPVGSAPPTPGGSAPSTTHISLSGSAPPALAQSNPIGGSASPSSLVDTSLHGGSVSTAQDSLHGGRGRAAAPTEEVEDARGRGRAAAPTEEASADKEQDTEPLPAIVPPARAADLSQQRGGARASWRRGGSIFAAYMAGALAAALLAALIQGSTIGSSLLAASFIPPGVPWFILVYGFMGGCLSGIVTLGRYQAAFPPNFVLITWFTRPFIGVVLAIIAYLFSNSGLLALSGSAIQHNALFSLLALLAGSCEGWLFRRRT